MQWGCRSVVNGKRGGAIDAFCLALSALFLRTGLRILSSTDHGMGGDGTALFLEKKMLKLNQGRNLLFLLQVRMYGAGRNGTERRSSLKRKCLNEIKDGTSSLVNFILFGLGLG